MKSFPYVIFFDNRSTLWGLSFDLIFCDNKTQINSVGICTTLSFDMWWTKKNRKFTGVCWTRQYNKCTNIPFFVPGMSSPNTAHRLLSRKSREVLTGVRCRPRAAAASSSASMFWNIVQNLEHNTRQTLEKYIVNVTCKNVNVSCKNVNISFKMCQYYPVFTEFILL